MEVGLVGDLLTLTLEWVTFLNVGFLSVTRHHLACYGDFAAAGSGRRARRLIVLCISNPNPNPNPSLVRDM